MGKRFSRYNFALKAVDGQAPSGSPAGKYKDYKTGVRKPVYVRLPGSNPGALVETYIAAFAAGGNTKYAIQYSQRAQTKMSDAGVSASLLNHLSAAGDTPPEINPGFSPAKAIVSKGGEPGAGTPSEITGVSYKKRLGAASYTYPFGRTLATGDGAILLNVMQAIRTAVNNAAASNSVSFQPEIFRL